MDKDERFKHITTDPKFKYIPKRERKVKIDKRFQSMFKDKKFKTKYTVDKRGRPVNYTSSEDLKRYYSLDTDDSDSESEVSNDEEVGKFVRAPKTSEDENESESGTGQEAESWNNEEVPRKVVSINDKIKQRLKDMNIDYARGQGVLISDSSSDDDSESDEYSEDGEVDHGWGELDKNAETTEEITNRLAICNMDWDRIRAVDLMVLFNSFLPPGGFIKSITIYPSDFGLQRMKEEEVKGPTELVESKTEEISNGEETEEGSKYHMEKLRQYQLNRLKYYYGVMVCDSPETANKIYTECDGVEYESSATKIDLRFIPDEMEFEKKPKEVCERIPDKYEPRFFTTTALQQAKVRLTWDETNPERIEMTKKLSEGKVDDISEADLQTYLASSTDEESESEEKPEAEESENESVNPIEKYRALLQDIEETEKKKKQKDIQMEITWDLNLKERSQQLVKKKLAEAEEKTPFQQYLDKRKEKRNEKRKERKKMEENKSGSEESDVPSDINMNDPYFAEEFNNAEFKKSKKKEKKPSESSEKGVDQGNAELELLLLNENEDNRKHFSLKKIQEREAETSKKKKKNKKGTKDDKKIEDNFKINVKDERFSALFSSHHFNIDPSDPHFRKTKATEEIIQEKLKRRATGNLNEEDNKKPKVEKKKDAELSVLVKSVQRKTRNLGPKK